MSSYLRRTWGLASLSLVLLGLSGCSLETPDQQGRESTGSVKQAAATACTQNNQCSGSDECIDGYCCAKSCGTATDDCQACNVAGSEGVCTTLAPGTTCRASTGECDPAETCNGAATCPADTKAPDETACTADTQTCTRDVCLSGVCSHPAGNAGTECRAASGECDVAETCNGTDTTCPIDAKVSDDTPCTADSETCTKDVCLSGVCSHPAASAGTPCRAASGECDVAESCNGTDTTCPTDAKVNDNTPCTSDGETCTKDVCLSGVCSHPAASAGTPCRASAGECDVAESCNGTDTTCPTDAKANDNSPCTSDGEICTKDVCLSGVCSHPAATAGTPCRAAVGECDVAETCNGTATTCPTDGKVNDNSPCTSDGETCTKDVCLSGVCSHPAATAGTPCRAAAGECDLAETCNGTDTTCPVDKKATDDTACTADSKVCTRDVCLSGVCSHPAGNAGTQCRASIDSECDPAETCNGTDADCPTDQRATDNSACTADSKVCTRDVCLSGVCSHPAGNQGTLCRASTDADCDPAESCNGSSVDCPSDAKAADNTGCTADSLTCSRDVCLSGVCSHPAGNLGTVCRASTDADCDPAEKCDGASTACPTDKKTADNASCTADSLTCTRDVCLSGVCSHPAGNSGTVCRASTDADCDPAEKCDGTNAACPADVKKSADEACTADTNVCTLDVCRLGKCEHPAGNAGTVCNSQVTDCEDPAKCTGGSTVCPAKPHKIDGTACTSDNNICSDDVCVSGVCDHSSPANPGEICRISGGACDVAETCTGTSTQCPADAKVPVNTVCRAAQGDCDKDEVCNGVANACPANAYLPPTTQCRAPSCASGVETLAANCTGSGASCPTIVQDQCNPYVCGTTACRTTCTQNAHCVTTDNYCDTGTSTCKTKKDNGGACTAATQCKSGNCVDGYCCNTACSGQCQACDVAGALGTCTPVTGKPHGARPACTTDGSACGGACNGTITNACNYPGATTQCRAALCNNNVAVLSAFCAGTGTCPTLQTQPCAPYSCSGTQCGGNCTSDANCNTTSFCSAGICSPKLDNGGQCSAANQCKSGHCKDGVCCNTACDGQCEACAETGSEGTCSVITGAPRGARPACTTDGSVCGGACDGTNASTCAYSSVVCRQGACANDVTTLPAKCDMGVCPAEQQQNCSPYKCSGDTCSGGCQVDGDCSPDYFCSGGFCKYKLAPGEACAGKEQCASGFCVDGLCCLGACVGQCEACDVAGQEGNCVPVAGAPHGARPSCKTDGTSCGGTCDGTDAVGCHFPTDTTQCREPSCTNGVATLAAGCDGQGSCPLVQEQACDPFLCVGNACGGNCTVDTDCAYGSFCAAGVCKERIKLGETCGGHNQCESAFCIDGVCCDSECTGQCEACDVADKKGTCSPATGAPHGGRPACSGVGQCQGQCDGADVSGCKLPGADKECSESTCAAGVETTPGSCDGKGTCNKGTTKPCGNYKCGETACNTKCTTKDDCISGLECISGACVVWEGGLPDAQTDAKTDVVTDAKPDSKADATDESDGGPTEGSAEDSGCGCRTAGRERTGGMAALLFAALAIAARRRR